MLKRLLPIPLLAFALLALACGDDAAETAAKGGDKGGEGAVKLSASDFSFSPATIEGEPGEELTLRIANKGNAQHTFTIDSLDVDETLDPGEVISIAFTPAGGERYYCRFHMAAQMAGSITAGGAEGATEDPPGGFGY